MLINQHHTAAAASVCLLVGICAGAIISRNLEPSTYPPRFPAHEGLRAPPPPIESSKTITSYLSSAARVAMHPVSQTLSLNWFSKTQENFWDYRTPYYFCQWQLINYWDDCHLELIPRPDLFCQKK
jgi:hypothetical protein